MSILKVLIVDDEPGIRSGTHRILGNFKVDYPFMDEHIEFEILEAATGEEAMIIVEEKFPDIVLLDNKLPGAQGIEVLEFIRKKQLDIVVVMITSYASLELAVKATRDVLMISSPNLLHRKNFVRLLKISPNIFS
ncbi:MAG: response regulator [Bacteroidota bacterium]